jgi:signal transduction histidine kinase
MRDGALSLMRLTSPPRELGLLVAIALIATETLAVYPLRSIAPETALGVVYFVGVLVVSSVWGLALGGVTAVLSTAAFDYFHVQPSLDFIPRDTHAWASLAVLLIVMLVLSAVTALARSRTIEVDERRGEADLAAEMARMLLRTDDLRSALPGASARLAQALRLPAVAIELETIAGDERRAAFPLRDGGTPLGTLLAPAELPQGTERRVRERVVPAVESLLRAAREREAMGSALKASRDELRVLAEEQAALRRVATVVARRVRPEEVFAAVVEEIGQLLPVDLVGMGRYEADGSETIVASWGRAVDRFPVGFRPDLGGQNLATTVFETGRPARLDDYADASGEVGLAARETGFRSSVGTPIIVEGRLWGVVIAGSSGEQPLPADTEARLADFTELVATAIANAESRAALAASRARIVAAADETRRRIERDLHDGIQQRLVSLVLELRAAQAAVPPQLGELDGELSRVAEGLASVFDELRDISRGIHPAILSKGGLGPALRVLARRSALPVKLDLHAVRRLPRHVEVAVYYVVSEALTNAAKYAQASLVKVEVDARYKTLRLSINDDGIGGANPAQGSGLVGLRDRIEALGGRLDVTSPAGGGTTLLIRIPFGAQSSARTASGAGGDGGMSRKQRPP